MKIKYIVLLVILAAGCGLTCWKWNTWFSNPPEAPYTTPHIQDRIILSLGEDAQTTRRISWRCDSMLTRGRVEVLQDSTADTLTIEAQGCIVSSRSGHSAFYKAEITGLIPGNNYRYRVANDTLHSAWYPFRMPASDMPTQFLYIGDVQDPAQGISNEWFSNIHHAYPHVDFWAFVGDVIERPTDSYWTHWFRSMDSITPSTPILAATGNHEYLKGVVKTLDPRWTYSFNNPENGPKEFEGRSYYIDFKDLCYIVMDTDGIQGPVPLYRHREWLKNVLATTTKKWKIVMMHHPVYSVRANRNNYYVRYTFKPLMEKYGVALALQGHDHGYARATTKTDDGRQTTPVYIVSSCSAKSYPIGFNPVHDRLGSNLVLYQYITIQGDSLHYRSYTQEHQVYDDLIILNDNNSHRIVDNAKDLPEILSLAPAYLNSKKMDTTRYNKQMEERQRRGR